MEGALGAGEHLDVENSGSGFGDIAVNKLQVMGCLFLQSPQADVGPQILTSHDEKV